MRQFQFLILVFFFKISLGQVDSIEYNIFEQIYDFQLENEKYYFKDFSNGNIIEKGQIVFNSKTYFENFNYELVKPEYQDSVQLAIISRTLQGYNESRLYDSEEEFIRICWFKHEEPVIFLIRYVGREINLVFKKGNGEYDIKGSLIIDSTLTMTPKNIKQFESLKSKIDFFNHRNSILCSNPEWWLPKTFFVEIKSAGKYNIFTITECNLRTGENYEVFKLFKYLIKLVNDKTDIKFINKYPNR